jgi:predicted metal-dependent RNase
MAKRKETTSLEVKGDKLEITPLGAGNEVGRSSVFMTFKGKNILVGVSDFKLNSQSAELMAQL